MRCNMRASAFAASSLILGAAFVSAQTSSSCNPVTGGDCPPDPALGKSETFDFTKGSSNEFTAQSNPTYDSNGASFTIAKSGDAPQINSKFYIMFGKVEVEMKAAPGAGIVSSVVMQSDDLDEIDWEWLGAESEQVQTNYFGKGQTTTYNRGAFSADPGSQQNFQTYTIDWTSDQTVWQIGGKTVRALQAQDADGQYPQTPMQIKIGAWSGGDSANAPGTIAWAHGPTSYANGPYSMVVKSLKVTDYSTGTQYKYNGQAGTWQSIDAVGGKVNPSGSGSDSSPAASSGASAPAATSMSPSMPFPFQGTHRDTTSSVSTPSGYPWVAKSTTLKTTTASQTSYPGLPSGWSVSSSGKVVPPSSAPAPSPPRSSSRPSPSSPVSAAGGAGAASPEVRTTFNQQGFPTVVTVVPGASNAPKRYDDQGFLITTAPAAPTAGSFTAKGASSGDASAKQQQKSDDNKDAKRKSSSPAASNAAPMMMKREGVLLGAICVVLVTLLSL